MPVDGLVASAQNRDSFIIDDNKSNGTGIVRSHARGATMDLSTRRPTTLPRNEAKSRGPSLRSIIRKSALLNLAIVVTSFPVLVMAGGPNAAVPALALMAGISVMIWTATFALYPFVSLAAIFRTPASSLEKPVSQRPVAESGLSDRWLDEPL
jgi:hypothetical protein